MDLLDTALTPLDGGYSGETFLAESAGERSVVRIYAHSGARRGPNAAEIDASVLRLVRGLLPVPEVQEVRRPDETVDTPGVLVTSYLEGQRLDLVLARADDELRATIGRNLGEVLARLSQMPMLRAGMFVDADLRVGAMPESANDLVEWCEAHVEGTALGEWPANDRDLLLEMADHAQRLLDTVDRVALVHGDFNPKNLLVDPDTGAITGLLDWEFAHAGIPFADLGNLLRFEREPVFIEAVLGSYMEHVPDAQGNLLELARAQDLYALIDLAGRRGANPVTDRAHDLLLSIARTGDLHALP